MQKTLLEFTIRYADLLAKVGKSHHGPSTEESDGVVEDIENPVESREVAWRAGRHSNPRP